MQLKSIMALPSMPPSLSQGKDALTIKVAYSQCKPILPAFVVSLTTDILAGKTRSES